MVASCLSFTVFVSAGIRHHTEGTDPLLLTAQAAWAIMVAQTALGLWLAPSRVTRLLGELSEILGASSRG
jgi:hypothetical protein